MLLFKENSVKFEKIAKKLNNENSKLVKIIDSLEEKNNEQAIFVKDLELKID
jgi:DNA-binding MarR family transcriptional regulator